MAVQLEELRARIVKLDTEISLQKKLLEKLENDRILAWRQLNELVDPVTRLPLEISSEIFLQSLDAPHVPIVLLNICHAWTDIALATPALWTAIRIRFPCSDGLAEVLPIWFQRAHNRPLSITISLRGHSSNWNYHVSAVLWKHGGQLKYLEISNDDLDETYTDNIDLFGGTTAVSLPLLETLAIRSPFQRRVGEYIVSQILHLLRQAPNILECIFDNYYYDSEILVLPTLRRLTIENPEIGDCFILHHLSLPALETLSMPMFLFSEDLLAVLKRSAAPVQNLTLRLSAAYTDYDYLLDCLHLVPSLLRLRISEGDIEHLADLFDAMAESPSLLPNLRDLNIHISLYPDHQPSISDWSWSSLVRALSARRMRFRIVPVRVPPPTDVLNAFRQLVLDGVDIGIGTENHNFLVVQ
ncbi:hypothetical protein C8R45DRAFT_964890 [Mycena sanguinolenta]|nr:hypothetical protein C8R45DRAFT_964890 [Mycena sanguinolenta]